jgi:hypothetical protein
MIIETPRLFLIETSAEVLAWRIGKRTARIGTVRNWNNACVRYQILKPRKNSHESPIKSCTMSCNEKPGTVRTVLQIQRQQGGGSGNRILRFETQQVQTWNRDWDSRSLEKKLRDVKKETSITKQNRKFTCVHRNGRRKGSNQYSQDNTQLDKIVTGSAEVMQQWRGDGNSVAKETARMPISHELQRKTPNQSQIKKARNPISAFRIHNWSDPQLNCDLDEQAHESASELRVPGCQERCKSKAQKEGHNLCFFCALVVILSGTEVNRRQRKCSKYQSLSLARSPETTYHWALFSSHFVREVTTFPCVGASIRNGGYYANEGKICRVQTNGPLCVRVGRGGFWLFLQPPVPALMSKWFPFQFPKKQNPGPVLFFLSPSCGSGSVDQTQFWSSSR